MIKRTICQAVSTILLLSSLQFPAGAEEVRYSTVVQPLFEARCVGCHGKDSPEYSVFKADSKRYLELFQGPRLDTYTHLISFTAWPDTGALMRRLDDGKNAKDGKRGNMFQYLGSSDEERLKNLNLFKAWVGNWTLKRWPDVTKEELNGIRVPY